jgi:predicted nucleic acid-binding protein
MPVTAYFDSSLWIAALGFEESEGEVRTLIEEIKRDKGLIMTSIITLTERSVRAWRSGPGRVAQGVQFVSGIASIRNVSQDVALLTAKIEVEFMTSVWSDPDGSRRRRWDAMHLATAATTSRADIFYTYDRRLLSADFSSDPSIPVRRRPQPLQGSFPLSP